MLDRQSILIVEDEPLIALGLSIEVEALEGSVIGPVSTAHEALSLMDSREISAAILDAHLIDRDVTPVALLLAQRGIPFVVHSSLGLPDELALALPELRVVRKPEDAAVVVGCLLTTMQPG
jgi:DNA-binding NarL/FixJ family response regulator